MVLLLATHSDTSGDFFYIVNTQDDAELYTARYDLLLKATYHISREG